MQSTWTQIVEDRNNGLAEGFEVFTPHPEPIVLEPVEPVAPKKTAARKAPAKKTAARKTTGRKA